MALFIFTRKILAGEPIEVFNYGQHARDFTYIDDIVEGVVRVLDRIAAPDPAGPAMRSRSRRRQRRPTALYNIGNNEPVELLHFIDCIERAVGRKADKIMLPLQPGDVPRTYADIEGLAADTGFRPRVSIEDGVERFVRWYRDHYGLA